MSDQRPTLIEVRHLRKIFGKTLAVDDVSFDIYPAEILALVGESGSGKTTVGRMISGLEDKSGGTVSLRGSASSSTENAPTAMERLPDRYRKQDFRRYGQRIQMIFQDPLSSLNPFFNAGEVISEALRFAGQKPTLETQLHWLNEAGLQPDHLHRLPHELSGGQRQRLCIARALCMRPEVIVSDESVSALDVSVQAQILALLLRLQDTHALTLIFITHDLNVVRQIASRVLVMRRGQIVESGQADQVFDAPQHEYTKALLAACPIPQI
ncbi:ABC transporter ATP-binding protein [Allohahella marinimesophila]|uniref:ATP-binding cassette domain-containing protein n=1 Tax=Allohahella marinimesophila TaxID=1054972 RepID=A0ABP7P0E1_9GAMM